MKMRTLCFATAGAFAYRTVARFLEPGPVGWQRQNYRGRTVSLLGGVSTAGALTLAAPLFWPLSRRERVALGLITTAASISGGVDDFQVAPARDDSQLPDQTQAETGEKQMVIRGLNGHARALCHGHLTTGMVKLICIGGASVVAAVTLPRQNRGWSRSIDIGIDATLMAGAANLSNLLDLRPGRAQKVCLLGATLVSLCAPRTNRLAPAGVAIGVAGRGMGSDLREETMLGDVGANPLGAVIGYSLTGLPRGVKTVVAGGITALILLSEKVSFSRVIDRVGPLRYLDRIGRVSQLQPSPKTGVDTRPQHGENKPG